MPRRHRAFDASSGRRQASEMHTEGDPETCFADLVPCYRHHAEQPRVLQGRLLRPGDLAGGRLSGEQNDLLSLCER